MQNAGEVRDVIQDVAARVREGVLDSQRGYAIASLARVALEAIQLIPHDHAQQQPDEHQRATNAKRASWAPPDLGIVASAPPAPADQQATA